MAGLEPQKLKALLKLKELLSHKKLSIHEGDKLTCTLIEEEGGNICPPLNYVN